MKNRFFHFTCKEKHIKWVEKLLEEEGYRFSPLSFFKRGRVLEYEPKPLGSSLASFFGLIYIHDKASFLPPLILEVPKESIVLDLCASPGGKTSLLSQMVGSKGLVLANEPNRKRFNTLKQNVLRLNLLNTILLGYAGEKFPELLGKIDYILLDVPCSGWGRDKIKNFFTWHEGNIDFLVELQRKLIKRAYEILSPGGKIVYSTCTTNPKENQDQIYWAISEFDLVLERPKRIKEFEYFDHDDFIMINGPKSDSQSFFVAVLKKRVNKFHSYISKKTLDYRIITSNFDTSLIDFLHLKEGVIKKIENSIFFIPYKALEFPQIKWIGFQLGELYRDDVILFSNIRALPSSKSIKNKLVITDVEGLKKLVIGQKFSVNIKDRWMALYWYDLPLGILKVSNQKAFWTSKVRIKRG